MEQKLTKGQVLNAGHCCSAVAFSLTNLIFCNSTTNDKNNSSLSTEFHKHYFSECTKPNSIFNYTTMPISALFRWAAWKIILLIQPLSSNSFNNPLLACYTLWVTRWGLGRKFEVLYMTMLPITTYIELRKITENFWASYNSQEWFK